MGNFWKFIVLNTEGFKKALERYNKNRQKGKRLLRPAYIADDAGIPRKRIRRILNGDYLIDDEYPLLAGTLKRFGFGNLFITLGVFKWCGKAKIDSVEFRKIIRQVYSSLNCTRGLRQFSKDAGMSMKRLNDLLYKGEILNQGELFTINIFLRCNEQNDKCLKYYKNKIGREYFDSKS